jgi:hypothetical protein
MYARCVSSPLFRQSTKKLETKTKDDVPDYLGMPTKDCLGLAQKVIADG